MIKIFITISLFSLLLNADVMSYYKNVLNTLHIFKSHNKTLLL